MESLPDLKMTAIAVLYQTKWNSTNRPNSFFVKEALSSFVSSLQDDDIGYFYDPKSPYEICTNPGELVGKIANSNLPYSFNFSNGIDCLMSILDTVENEYNRIGVIISDCMSEGDIDKINSFNIDAKIYVFNIGKTSFEGVINLKTVSELAQKLSEIQESLI